MKLTYKKSIYGWGENGSRLHSYLGTLPNTIEGNKTFHHLRKTKKLQNMKVTRNGRNPNRKKIAEKYGLDHDSLRQHLPIKYSTSFDVYCNPK